MANTAVTTLRVGGQNVATPGARSQVKQTTVQSPSLASNGVIAIIGPARNGAPQTVLEFDTLEGVQDYLKLTDLNGDIGLRLAAEWACDASNDDAVQGKPARIVLVKTNRDTQSVATLFSGAGALCALTSVDYGAHANKINVIVANGTASGRKITIKDGLGGTPEIGDNLGGAPAFSLQYTGEADLASLTVDGSGVSIAWQAALTGKNGSSAEVKNGWAAGTVFLKSANAHDVFQRVTIYGLSAGNVPISTTVLLAGTTILNPSLSFAKLTGASLDGVTIGAVSIASLGGVDFDTNKFITLAGTAPDTAYQSAAEPILLHPVATENGQVELVGYGATADIAAGTGLIAEVVTISGGDAVSVNTFKQLLRARWLTSTPPSDAIHIVNQTTGDPALPLITVDPSHLSPGYNNVRGISVVDSIPQAGAITLAIVSPGGAIDIVVRGRNAQGAAVAERLTTAAQVTANTFAQLDWIELGALATTVTVTLTGVMLQVAAVDTVEDLINLASQHDEFTLVGYDYTRPLSKLDAVGGLDCKTAPVGLFAGAWDVIDWINDTSALVTAVAATSPSGLPSVTGTPLFLTGATTVSTVVQDYLDALKVLKTVDDINHVVPLSTDSAVHAALRDHCDAWFIDKSGGRQGYVGVSANTKADIKSATAILNDENIVAWNQNVPRYDSNGVLRTYGPICGAVLLAGMKASSPTGEPLTWKFMKTDGDVTQTGWDPSLDSEELLRCGLCFAENLKGQGTRIVRSITTYQKKPDPNRTELSCWESVLACKKDLTDYLGLVTTGKRRSRLSDATVAKLSDQRLDAQQTAEMIEGHTKSAVVPAAGGQGKAVSVQITADQPNNFTLLTLNL